MIVSNNLLLVCVSIACFAAGYNFASGSGDALAYDSLKLVNRQGEYAKYESNQLVIYRLCEGISTLCAGLAFMKSAKKAIVLMFCNSFVGAVDILLLFFLQAKLLEDGIPGILLGVALFVIQLGGIMGARIILFCRKVSYRTIGIVAAILVILGVILEHSGVIFVMTMGGFIAALGDDALQVRTNTKLQEMFPSKQRATLISVESFTFSVIMIVLSPLVGILFSWW